jgi:hypothetical protein
MIPDDPFPRLSARNHRRTSPASIEYNCVAWAAGDTGHWWEPGAHWPTEVRLDEFSFGIAVLEDAFKALGYQDCGDDRSLEPGFDKVALYGDMAFYTHVSRQLPTGKWTSKLGKDRDIEHHTPEDVAGGIYGEVVQIMRRPIARG